MRATKLKLGKNPFEKKVKSQVGRMIEASFESGIEERKSTQDRGFLVRIQEMKISLDLKEVFKFARERTR